MSTVNPNRFIFIVDSYAGSFGKDLHSLLNTLGLTRDQDYHLTGARGAEMLLSTPSMLNSPKLLVFSSTFYGDIDEGIAFAQKVKKANPDAKIIFRSADARRNPNPEIFSGFMTKADHSFITEVKAFLQD